MQSVGPRIDLFIAWLLVALFTLSSVGVGVASVAIWRSASTHQRIKWWEGLLVYSAKLYAALTGTTAFVVLVAILYGLLHYGLTGRGDVLRMHVAGRMMSIIDGRQNAY